MPGERRLGLRPELFRRSSRLRCDVGRGTGSCCCRSYRFLRVRSWEQHDERDQQNERGQREDERAGDFCGVDGHSQSSSLGRGMLVVAQSRSGDGETDSDQGCAERADRGVRPVEPSGQPRSRWAAPRRNSTRRADPAAAARRGRPGGSSGSGLAQRPRPGRGRRVGRPGALGRCLAPRRRRPLANRSGRSAAPPPKSYP